MTARMPLPTSVSSRTSSRHRRAGPRGAPRPARSRAWTARRGRTRRAGPSTDGTRRRAAVRCCWRYACRSPSRARYASAATPLAVSPRMRRDLGGRQPLDLGVPQHGLPPLGQRGVRPGDDRLLQPLQGRVDERHPRVVRGQVVGDRDPAAGAGPVVRVAAQAVSRYARKATSGPPPPCTTESTFANASETRSSASLGSRVICRARARAAPTCRSVQGTERRLVAGPDSRDQLRVARTRGLGGPGLGLERGQVGHGLDSPSARARSIVDGVVTQCVLSSLIRPYSSTARGRPAAHYRKRRPRGPLHDGLADGSGASAEIHRRIPRHG